MGATQGVEVWHLAPLRLSLWDHKHVQGVHWTYTERCRAADVPGNGWSPPLVSAPFTLSGLLRSMPRTASVATSSSSSRQTLPSLCPTALSVLPRRATTRAPRLACRAHSCSNSVLQ